MSKYTKVIAALGVAAGLGVASLPFGAFAAEYVGTGEVEVNLTVPETITMTIDTTNVPDAGENPTPGTAVNLGKIEAGKSSDQATEAGNKATTITVKTNKPNGYTLQAKGEVLTNTNEDLTTNNTIGLFSTDGGTALTANDATTTTEGWGINVTLTNPSGVSHEMAGKANFGQTDKYYMTAGLSTIDEFANGEIEGEGTYSYVIKYGANVAESKPAGTYQGTATYVTTGRAN